MKNVVISDLLQLTIAERIQLVEDLWDSIAAEATDDPDRLPIIEAQRQELDRRAKRHQQSPHEAVPLDEALERIERSLE
jgi:putative addiction module component (TIGR02574 family)